ncbi:MAG: hypothetical protein IPI61_10070 [Syntrophaceae bacterium]|nr:hypothetical protein [Syntrophaceae bacterium]
MIYHSPLLEAIPRAGRFKTEEAPAEDKSVVSSTPTKARKKHFMIDEKATVDELIARIGDSESSRNNGFRHAARAAAASCS